MTHAVPFRSNILVIHQDPLLCAGVLAALRQHAPFLVFANDVDAAIGDRPRIDVVVADYGHAMRLVEATARASDRSLAAARILVLTSNDREVDIRRAIEAGIHGYLLLGGPLNELVDAVTTVATGARYMCRSVAQRMADSLTHTSLTSRQIDVLRLAVTGESNKSIARQLQIEVGTVKSHMSAIMTKLGATSRTQAAGIAATRGLVEEREHVQPAPIGSRAALFAAQTQLA
jgi:DNA-binding NarL/FixJ family response regulator